jgi:hypothetical protein
MRSIKIEKTYLFFNVMNDSLVFTPALVVKKCDTMLKSARKLTQLYLVEKSNESKE